MKIAILVEGKTERVFKPLLVEYLKRSLSGNMPKLDFVPQAGRIPTKEKLQRVVERLLGDRHNPADAVIALTDVYTGTNPPDFQDADEAKQKMKEWVGNTPNFYPHVAQYDFEAWLLPYWSKIQKLAGSKQPKLGSQPEKVNHNNPPAYRLKSVFRTGSCRKDYVKPRDAPRILKGEDLGVAIHECPEMKSFVSRIIELSGGTPIT